MVEEWPVVVSLGQVPEEARVEEVHEEEALRESLTWEPPSREWLPRE